MCIHRLCVEARVRPLTSRFVHVIAMEAFGVQQMTSLLQHVARVTSRDCVVNRLTSLCVVRLESDRGRVGFGAGRDGEVPSGLYVSEMP